jgi:hypothetical protein
MNFSMLEFDLYSVKIKLDIFVNPDKYAVCISTDKIVADPKVCAEGVKRYERQIDENKDIGTLIVVKHPRKDLYAVLDGHHKYHALKNKGLMEMKCAVIPDYVIGLLFLLTKKGVLQPSKEFTKYVRVPLKRAEEFLYEFLSS